MFDALSPALNKFLEYSQWLFPAESLTQSFSWFAWIGLAAVVFSVLVGIAMTSLCRLIVLGLFSPILLGIKLRYPENVAPKKGLSIAKDSFWNTLTFSGCAFVFFITVKLNNALFLGA